MASDNIAGGVCDPGPRAVMGCVKADRELDDRVAGVYEFHCQHGGRTLGIERHSWERGGPPHAERGVHDFQVLASKILV